MKLTITGITLTVDCPQFKTIEDALDTIINKEKLIMAKLDETLAKLKDVGTKMTNLNTAFDGMRVDIQALKDQLAALLSGEVLSDVVAAKVQEISDAIDALAMTVDDTAAENFPQVTPSVGPEV